MTTEQSAYYTEAELQTLIQRELAKERATKPRRREGLISSLLWWGFLLAMSGAFILLTADHFKVIPQSMIDRVLPATAGVVFSTPVAAPAQRPASQPHLTPSYRATPAPVFSGMIAQEPTAEPIPTTFWTAEELAQFEATATAFIEVIPTAPPAFIEYTLAQCKDAEIVAASALLRAWCPKGE